MKKILLILLICGLFSFSNHSAMARPYSDDVVSNFMFALFQKDEKLAKTYLNSNVNIPEIREATPFKGFSGLPSPNENVRVTIAYFDDGDNAIKRIAYIWEITYEKEKITDIRVVYDGSNPFKNELKMIEKYETKNNINIDPPSEFPFEVTHVDGIVDEELLIIRYRNADINGLLQIKIEHSKPRIETKDDKTYMLKNGIKALYQPNFTAGEQLTFQYRNLTYSISISRTTELNYSVDDLLKVANSMIRNN